ncbi:MAG: type VI secretion system-associated FHA domain protein TagH [Xanthomonadales bacterium]|nr:type VI secretion system-associated FHA domain protein TagH [Xanthomonadales bacterium]
MSLSLKITSYQRLTPSQQSVYQAESDSFTIGRNHENDWAIPDPQRFLSGVHCRIHKEGDGYQITDTSTNGVFLNGSEERLIRNESVDLNAGDRFRIGDYEFEVVIEDSALDGNPYTSNEETMTGADPFDGPYSVAGSPTEPESFSGSDPFEDDPFVEPLSKSQSPAEDDDFLENIGKPLSSLGDSPLEGNVSIDSLMGFDDDLELEDQDSAEELKQRHTPLKDSFKPSGIGDSPEPSIPEPPTPEPKPDANTGGFESFQDAFPDEFPDNWDETTGMLKIPVENDPFESTGNTDFPDNWDEATGMLKVPVAPEPPKADKPAPVAPKPKKVKEAAPPTPAPQKPVATAPPTQSGDAAAAFARGAGLELSQISGFEQDVLFEQVGRMLVMFTEGLIQTLGGRTHIKSEFRLDQTMIRPAENNPFKFSTSKTRTLLQLLSKSDPAYKSGVNAIREGFDDVNAHQMAVIAGMEAALQDILARFNPQTLEKRIVSDSILDSILPGGKKAKYWDIFKLLFDEIAGEAEDNFQQLFGREFSRAYEEQLSRLKKTRKE